MTTLLWKIRKALMKPDKNYAGEGGILNTVLMNRNLLWEETTSTDLGLEAGFPE